MPLTIYGASDDLIEIEGHVREELNPPYEAPAPIKIANEAGGCIVVMRYCDNGTWSVEVQMLDEDVSIPWPITIARAEQCDYSVAVTIDCPDDVTFQQGWD